MVEALLMIISCSMVDLHDCETKQKIEMETMALCEEMLSIAIFEQKEPGRVRFGRCYRPEHAPFVMD